MRQFLVSLMYRPLIVSVRGSSTAFLSLFHWEGGGGGARGQDWYCFSISYLTLIYLKIVVMNPLHQLTMYTLKLKSMLQMDWKWNTHPHSKQYWAQHSHSFTAQWQLRHRRRASQLEYLCKISQCLTSSEEGWSSSQGLWLEVVVGNLTETRSKCFAGKGKILEVWGVGK